MYPWKRWLIPGLVASLVLTVLTVLLKSESIRTDIAARTTERLAAAGSPWANVAVDGRSVTLSGRAPTPGRQQIGVETAAAVFGVKEVYDETTVLPEAVPYVWEASRTGDTVTLSGAMPSEAVKAATAAAAARGFPGLRIVDDTVLRRGAPEKGLPEAAAFALAQLARLETGAVKLIGLDLRIEGRAGSLPDTQALFATLAAPLPGGVSLAYQSVTPAAALPYSWTIAREPGGIALAGVVPDAATRARLVDLARRAFPTTPVEDRQFLASGAQPGFAATAAFAIERAADLLPGGRITLADGLLYIDGQAESFAAHDRLTAALAVPIPGAAARGSIAVRPPEALPFALAIEKAGGGLTLSGVVPSEDVRKALLARAAGIVAPSTIRDRTRLAAGDPAGFGAVASYAVGRMGDFENGRITVDGLTLHMEGVAATPESYGRITAGLSDGAPAIALRGSGAVTPATVTPYAFIATRRNGAVVLSGSVPGAEPAAAILAAARRAFPGAGVTDKTRIAAGEPAGFVAAASALLARLSDLEAGEAVLGDRVVHLSGKAETVDAFERLTAAPAAGLPAGFVVGRFDIAPATVRPYALSATLRDGTLSLAGVAPAGAAAAIAAAASKAVPGAKVESALRVADGAPAGFVDIVDATLGHFAKLEIGSVIVDGLSVHVAGKSRTPAAHAELETALAAPLPAGYRLATRAIEPAVAADWHFTAVRDLTKVTITGYAPSAEARAAILAKAKAAFGATPTTADLAIAAGQPAGYRETVEFALSTLAKLAKGEVRLDYAGLGVSGDPADAATYDAIVASLRAGIPGGAKLASEALRSPTPKPYVFAFERSGRTVELSGYLPNRETKVRILDVVTSAMPGVEVRDTVTIAAGAQPAFEVALEAGILAATRLESPRVEMWDTRIDVTGQALYPAAAVAAKAAVEERLPRGFSANLAGIGVKPPEPPVAAAECQALLDTSVKEGSITFDVAAATIRPESARVLDRLVSATMRCPAARIAIEGHTDSDGEPDANQRLSEARAASVVDYFVKAGLSRDQLLASGHGATRPIASNATAAGKLANRRIEFRVVGP